MTMESDLSTLLQSICVRVYPDIAPEGAARPYLTWQGIGGKSWRNLDNTPADKRNTFMQVNAWSLTRMEANSLIRQIEDALCASVSMICTPDGEPISMYESDTKLYGSMQRFSIISAR